MGDGAISLSSAARGSCIENKPGEMSVMTEIMRISVAMILCLAWTTTAHAVDKVRMSYTGTGVNSSGIFLALDKGYFTEEELAVELVNATGNAATPALMSGDIQFSGSPSTAMTVMLRGAKLKVIHVAADSPAVQVWTLAEIGSLADLKGRQLGLISRGDTMEIAMLNYLAARGLPFDYFSFTPLGPNGPTRTAALLSGSFPAILTSPVDGEMTKMMGGARVKMLMDLRQEVKLVFGGVATSDALIKSSPDLVRRFMRAMVKGYTHAKTIREDTVQIVMRYGSNREAAEKDYDNNIGVLSNTGLIPEDTQLNELRVRGEVIGIARDKLPTIRDIFDFSFVQAATTSLAAEGWKPK